MRVRGRSPPSHPLTCDSRGCVLTVAAGVCAASSAASIAGRPTGHVPQRRRVLRPLRHGHRLNQRFQQDDAGRRAEGADGCVKAAERLMSSKGVCVCDQELADDLRRCTEEACPQLQQASVCDYLTECVSRCCSQAHTLIRNTLLTDAAERISSALRYTHTLTHTLS